MTALENIDCYAKPTADLTPREREIAIELFRANYREANVAYLEKSFGTLKYIAFALSGGTPAGFALGETRIIDLPRLPEQPVALAGICCVGPEFRRRGLFGQLERAAMMASGIQQLLWLSCGRMAHPASMRTMRDNPTLVPKPGVPPSAWHREIGQALADIYGVHRFDPETFLCIGGGTPIGYPVMEIAASSEEWDAFRHVDRSRGDALLGMCWQGGAAPERW